MSSPKKRLLLLSVTLGRGGAEKHLVRVANALVDRYEIHVAVVRAGGSYEQSLAGGVHLHHIGSVFVRLSTVAGCHVATSPLAKLIDQIAPACVISFLPPVTYTCYRARMRCSHRFKHVVAIQNNLDESLDSRSRMMQGKFRQGVCDAILDADGVIAISNGVAENLHQRFPSLNATTQTIYNAAIDPLEQAIVSDDAAANGAAEQGSSDTFKIIACGRLTEQKGFCDLLDAFRIVRDREKASLQILGTGPLHDTLVAQANRLGIAEDVEFLGFQTQPLNHFAAADLFVLSSWWEGFGNVLVEAMGVGTPVVSTDCPYGPSEIITHGCSGLLVPPRSPKQLADQIIEVIRAPQLRRELSLNGIKRAQSFHTSVIADQYAEFIDATTAQG
ncbi:N-acetylgalactosamine-N,N'-diacetylbacillosaminyl-diphospho-undecaprenol 4-alpha-N-acetylgalactosaminyltransferase [Stieleria maiorica]|uniref:N-acetylgalactosamine-N, N'-diacetylbacillosaminyl-diphospho-undecaprenol 4-alpha-N-acetylgalactosaminyltransferase n=1 Tax=Stieleria maiorica TaxID=2795974 RepID=A0A5B9MBZ3_9BACT|nr:glycosyltransferase [Stieleria maiorica]QEF98722.1 N-acetylgalactosamine-N,N'-diacetylbacillosaminyl-diphospho-undecaprenol 4-alpha-N-acetylgalactosaminyltransferase [Stieleria maiorica]